MANKSKVTRWRQIEQSLLAVITGVICLLLLIQLDWLEITAELAYLWQNCALAFSSVDSSTISLIMPSLLGVAVTFIIIQLYPANPPKWLQLVVMLVLLLLLGRYLLWRLFASLNLADPLNGTLSIFLLVLEILGWILGISTLLLSIFERDRSAEADRMSEAVLHGEYTPWVDVFVPTYNESVAILRRTIIGCQGMDYPYKQVYLLDDRRRREMKDLARELDCCYLTRPDNRHAKAGNINHALAKTSSELVAVFDCDFIPTRNFLTRTIGFFQQSDIALVQTNKAYYNSDPVRHNLGLQNVITNDEDLFFESILSGRDTVNSAICCGSSFVVRRRILDVMGGIPTGTIVEDFATSLKIQALGKRIIYLNEALSAGLSPENISGYIDQRLRWGQGTIQILFCRANPFTLPGLNLVQRFVNSLGIFSWFQPAADIVLLCLPLAYLWWGITPILVNFSELLFFFMPYYFTLTVVFAWLNGSKRSLSWANVYGAITAFPLAFMIINTAIDPFGKGFKVTPKGVLAKKAVLNWQAASPLLILFLLYLVSIGAYLFNWQWLQNADSASLCLFWSIYNTCILFVAILVYIDVPQQVLATGFPHQLDCQLILEERVFNGTTQSLSEKSAIICFDIHSSFDEIERTGFLNIPSISLFNAPILIEKVNLDRQSNLLAEIKFVKLDLAKQRKLIDFLFGQPNRWQKQSINEVKSLLFLIVSIFRIDPLTRDFSDCS